MAIKTQNHVDQQSQQAQQSKNCQTGAQFKSLNDLLIWQLMDLYDAENQLVKTLPAMARAADSEELKQVFEKHSQETTEHVTRLENALKKLGVPVKRKSCKAMEGIIAECNEAIQQSAEPCVHDAFLIAAAQRVEHYEIAGYGCTRAFAKRLGHHEVAEWLGATLEEEYAADKKFTEIAESGINEEAVCCGTGQAVAAHSSDRSCGC